MHQALGSIPSASCGEHTRGSRGRGSGYTKASWVRVEFAVEGTSGLCRGSEGLDRTKSTWKAELLGCLRSGILVVAACASYPPQDSGETLEDAGRFRINDTATHLLSDKHVKRRQTGGASLGLGSQGLCSGLASLSCFPDWILPVVLMKAEPGQASGSVGKNRWEGAGSILSHERLRRGVLLQARCVSPERLQTPAQRRCSVIIEHHTMRFYFLS